MNRLEIAAQASSKTFFNSHQKFIDTLYGDIHSILERMEGSSEKYYCDDEDKITSAIVLTLCELGYDATEQTKKNGTVDITVKAKENEFIWIGEAKIGYGNTKIFEGMLQILSRYMKRDSDAGLLIYFQKSGSHTAFNSWLKYLYHKEWVKYCNGKGTLKKVEPLLGHLKSTDYRKTDNYYHDLSVFKPCGKAANIRMFYADLHHDPADKSSVTAQSLKLGQAKNSLRKYCQKWEDGEFYLPEMVDLFESLKLVIDFDHDEKLDLNMISEDSGNDN